jgi:hypothetical protein
MSKSITIEAMKKLGIPLTRENYLLNNYPDYTDPRFELSAEAEAAIPEEVLEPGADGGSHRL